MRSNTMERIVIMSNNINVGQIKMAKGGGGNNSLP